VSISATERRPAPSLYLKPDYRPDIDGLRAVAVLAVIGFHLFPSYCPGGFVGVDVFFVISGFLISSIVFRGAQTGRFSFATFYTRRIRRIFPSLVVVLAAFLALGWAVLSGYEYRQVGKQSAASAAFVSNIVLWQESGYFDTEAELKPMLHLWSLGVEEQFYLVWPLLIVILLACRANLFWSVASITACSFALNVSTIHSHASATFYLPLTRMWEPLSGALLAYATLRPGDARTRFLDRTVRVGWLTIAFRDVVASAGAMAILASLYAITQEAAFPGWNALAPVGGAFLLMSAGAEAWLNQRILAHRALVFLGSISYPLYLWHWPLLSFARIVGSGTPPASVRLAVIGLALILASLTYYLIEKPIRFSKHTATPIVLLLTAAAVGSAGYVVYDHAGFAWRFPQDNTVQNNNDAFAAYVARMPRCAGSLGGAEQLSYCRVSGKGEPSIALFGDSHAEHLFPGIAHADRERTWLLIGQSGCAPIAAVRSHLRGNSEVCLASNDRILATLVASSSISTIVLSSNGPYYISEAESYTPGYTLAWGPKNWMLEFASGGRQGKGKKDIFAYGLAKTVEALEQAHKRSVIYIDVPGLPFMPFDCNKRIRLGGLSPVCAIDRSYALQQQRNYREVVARVQRDFPKTLVFDPVDYLCPKSNCNLGTDAGYYRDAHHLSLPGSDYIAQFFLSWLKSQGL